MIIYSYYLIFFELSIISDGNFPVLRYRDHFPQKDKFSGGVGW